MRGGVGGCEALLLLQLLLLLRPLLLPLCPVVLCLPPSPPAALLPRALRRLRRMLHALSSPRAAAALPVLIPRVPSS